MYMYSLVPKLSPHVYETLQEAWEQGIQSYNWFKKNSMIDCRNIYIPLTSYCRNMYVYTFNLLAGDHPLPSIDVSLRMLQRAMHTLVHTSTH